jgi:histidine triad (HIT) family protein
MADCIFCKIAKGEAPATIRYEDEEVIAFDDINPKAPIHVLIVPREHIESTLDLTSDHDELTGKMIRVAANLAKKMKIADSGYKIIINTGRDSGQLVDHLHLHLLGGKTLERLEV